MCGGWYFGGDVLGGGVVLCVVFIEFEGDDCVVVLGWGCVWCWGVVGGFVCIGWSVGVWDYWDDCWRLWVGWVCVDVGIVWWCCGGYEWGFW